jgi:hypothetical protein
MHCTVFFFASHNIKLLSMASITRIYGTRKLRHILGSTNYLYLNKIQIDSAYDTSYNKGEIGVLAKAFDKYRPTEVAFRDATVWTLLIYP